MKQRVLFFLLLFYVSIAGSMAQQLKTHKGEIYGGNETYTYYIDTETNDQVRQGAYSFSKSDKNSDGASSTHTIKGQYVNGYKNGAWLYTFKNVDVENGSNNYVTGVISMTMTYKDGMPEGAWSYSSTGKRRSRKYSFGGWSWGSYVATEPTNINVSFKDGIMVGNVTYTTPWVEAKGKLDDEGWLVGQWRVNKQGLMVEFVNGVDLFDPKDKELTELQRKVAALAEGEREDFCLENDLSMELRSGKNFFDLNDGYFDNGMWLHRKITGDKTYKSEDGLNYKDSREYGKYLIIDRKKFRSLTSINSWWNYDSSVKMRKMLDNHINELSRADQLILNEAIKGREIMEKMVDEYTTQMGYYTEFKNFKTPNSFNMTPSLLSVYKKIEDNAKSKLNAAINVDTLKIIEATVFQVNLRGAVDLKSYSSKVDYGVYLEKLKEIAPALNTIQDSLKTITLLHKKLIDCSQVMRNEFTSSNLQPMLRPILNNYTEIVVPKLEHATSLSEALGYAEAMSKAATAIRELDKLHILIEKSSTKSISLGSYTPPASKSLFSSGQNKLVKMYYTIAEQMLAELATNFDYETLSELCEVASKVESLKDTNTKSLEKLLKKEPDTNRKMQIILAQ